MPASTVIRPPSDLLLKDARSQDFCGLLVPGGFMPDKLRRDPNCCRSRASFLRQGKLVAFICHGGWIPISAKILEGQARHRLAVGIKDDLENAGGIWVNEPVVVEGNLVSSRTPRDLGPFGEAMNWIFWTSRASLILFIGPFFQPKMFTSKDAGSLSFFAPFP